MKKIRQYEMATRWRDEARSDIFAGMAFTRARESIHESILWKIVQRLPKGSLLHAHFDAMVESKCTCLLRESSVVSVIDPSQCRGWWMRL